MISASRKAARVLPSSCFVERLNRTPKTSEQDVPGPQHAFAAFIPSCASFRKYYFRPMRGCVDDVFAKPAFISLTVLMKAFMSGECARSL